MDKEVPSEMLDQVLVCGLCAPSSMDCQPWHFLVVRDKNQKEELAKLKSADNHKHILSAPVVIVVCVDTEKSPKKYIEDGVTASENILLAVHALGLGSVYLSGYNFQDRKLDGEIRNILSLPENIIPVTILPIGYADPSEKLSEKNLVDLEDVKHGEKW